MIKIKSLYPLRELKESSVDDTGDDWVLEYPVTEINNQVEELGWVPTRKS